MAELRVTSISCGSHHSLAVLSDGRVVSWGRGEDGQLGHGDAADSGLPREIASLLQHHFDRVHCGAEYSVAISLEQDKVYSWGWGDFGRLGHGHATDVYTPMSIPVLEGRHIQKLACGDTHTLAISAGGEIYAFGRNQNGQLGLGNTQDILEPTQLQSFVGQQITSIACGGEHSLATTSSGKLYAWGWGQYGNLGTGSVADLSTPTEAQGLGAHHMVSVACGWRHSAAVDRHGALFTFGWSRYGQLGHGDFVTQIVPRRVMGLAGRQICLVSGGWRHSLAADTDGTVYAWGWNKFGQLGLGSREDSAVPQPVKMPQRTAAEGSSTPADQSQPEQAGLLACGWRHSVMVTRCGKTFSWGRGASSQLGHAHSNDRDELAPRCWLALSAGSICIGEGRSPLGGEARLEACTAEQRYAAVPSLGPIANGPRGADQQRVPNCR